MDSRSEAEDLARSFAEHEHQRLRSLIEAALFASPEPVTVGQLARALEEPDELVERCIVEITAEHEKPQHGVFIRKFGTGYQMRTKPEHHEALKEVLRGLRPRTPLSLPALQTLAVIAYKQPISAPEIGYFCPTPRKGKVDPLSEISRNQAAIRVCRGDYSFSKSSSGSGLNVTI